MSRVLAVMVLSHLLSACAAVSVASTAVETTAGIAGTVAETAVGVVTAPLR